MVLRLALCFLRFVFPPRRSSQKDSAHRYAPIRVGGQCVTAATGISPGSAWLGYVEGKNLQFEYRYAGGKLDRVPEFAAELVRLNVDILVTDTSNATQAAKDATKTIPVVFTIANDPVGDNQVASLAKPGGNLTGFSLLTQDLNGKRLEILKESVPSVERVAFLTRSGTSTGEQRFKEAESAARGLGLRLQFLGAKGSKILTAQLKQPNAAALGYPCAPKLIHRDQSHANYPAHGQA